MLAPDQALFEEDIAAADFRSGMAKGKWGQPDAALLEDFKWPKYLLWIRPAVRPNAPDRFYISMDAAGYRTVPPTGTFWDPATKAVLSKDKRPKGKPNSRVAKVFRTDWNDGTAFYHPYDRAAAGTHKDWEKGGGNDPRRHWTIEHTIVDYLEEFYSLLNCGDYIGI